METFPATAQDLAQVAAARAAYRAHWLEFRHMPFPAPFDGSLEDIRALDYLDYEGLPDPPCGISGAALVWGGVVASVAGFEWRRTDRDDLVLVAEEPGYRLAVWPLARVFEAQFRSYPQYDKYLWLLRKLVKECSEENFCPPELEARVRLLGNAGDGADARDATAT